MRLSRRIAAMAACMATLMLLAIPAAHAGVFTCFGQPVTIPGTAGNDALLGTPGDDVIAGFGGDDSINGGGGNDLICGGPGGDFIAGGAGNDRIDGGPNADSISFLFAPNGVTADLASGTSSGEGNDNFMNVNGISGSPYDDHLYGDSQPTNVIDGIEGNDVIDGRGGNDLIEGGPGNDTENGGRSVDFASWLFSSAPVDANLSTHVATGDGTDSIRNFEGLVGSQWNDTLTGDALRNFFVGDPNAGYDGNDAFNGMGGRDYVLYLFASNAVAADLRTGVANGEGYDTMKSIESLYGSSYGDSFDGDNKDNGLFGGPGDDTLIGHQGHDYVNGGYGTDQLDGGGSFDQCPYGEMTRQCEGQNVGSSWHSQVEQALQAFRKH